MMNQTTKLLLGSLIAALTALGLSGVAIYAFPGPAQVTMVSGSTNVGKLADCGFATSCAAFNPSGFALNLWINSTIVKSNGSLTFSMTEFNPTTKDINLSKSDNWYVNDATWPCNAGTIPLGIAVYRGQYGLGNVSTAKDTLKFGIQTCMYMGNSTTYVIPSLNVLVPNHQLVGDSQIYATSGRFAKVGNFLQSVNSLGSSSPATYTLAAADEWGDIVLLHFTVISGSS